MFTDIITDIEKALAAEAYLSALALSLALPDICGKVEFPNIKSNKERYIKWYDSCITAHDYPSDFDDVQKFDGAKCYKLRCSFLHAGEVDQLDGIDKFSLKISARRHSAYYGGSFYKVAKDHVGNEKYDIELDVAQLCFKIYHCANGFYKSHPDPSAFEKISPIQVVGGV